MYRLHIDIPLGTNEEDALHAAKQLMEWYFIDIDAKDRINRLTHGVDLSTINYRLGHDEDRQKSNYLDINENGHASNKKIRISMENA
tara:strand:- start:157 stop:417 length:261 start_codon:yes stop_codon:yes gene_type:complete